MATKSQKFDFKTINRYLSPRTFDDVNGFVEKLPQNAGKTVLIAAGVAWVFVAALGIFTTIKAQDLNNLRAQLQDAKALKPIVPTLSEVPVDAQSVEAFAKEMSAVYENLDIKPNGNSISITSANTAFFNLFREAVIQLQNGGKDWKISLERMCVGRECKQNQLSIFLKINKINIDKPAFESVNYTTDSKSPTETVQ